MDDKFCILIQISLIVCSKWSIDNKSALGNGLPTNRRQFTTDQVKSDLISIALTHRGRVTHLCVGELTIIGSDNGLSPGRHQTIIWTNAGILLIETFSEKKIHLKMSSGRCRPSCISLNVLKLFVFVGHGDRRLRPRGPGLSIKSKWNHRCIFELVPQPTYPCLHKFCIRIFISTMPSLQGVAFGIT